MSVFPYSCHVNEIGLNKCSKYTALHEPLNDSSEFENVFFDIKRIKYNYNLVNVAALPVEFY